VRLVDCLEFAPDDEGLVRCLIGDAIVATDVAVALELRRAGIRAPIVTVGGAVLRADGRIEGGQGDELSAGMLESKREARELAGEIERLESLLAGRLEALAATRHELGEVGRMLDASRQELHARELVALTAEKDLQKSLDQLKNVAHRLGALATEESELVEAIDDARVERDTVAVGLADADVRIEAAQHALREGESALQKARVQRDTEREALLARRVSLAAIAEKIAAARAVETRLGRSASELEERLAHLADEIVATQAGLEETTA
jgi:chromosome segregation protein